MILLETCCQIKRPYRPRPSLKFDGIGGRILNMSRNPIVVVTGPSGSGKTTLCNYLVENYGFTKPRTCTTRAPRAEEDQDAYIFMTREEFQNKIKRGEMAEYVEAFGNYYGSQLMSFASDTKIAVPLNAEGARTIKRMFPTRAIVMMLNISRETMLQRITRRSFIEQEQLLSRISDFESGYKHAPYDYVINSDQSIKDVRRNVDEIIHRMGNCIHCGC